LLVSEWIADLVIYIPKRIMTELSRRSSAALLGWIAVLVMELEGITTALNQHQTPNDS